jgi:3,4-dihydroxy 2-butanone 4-phosphate synthase/GTP cyclohydrolase II
MKSNTNKNLIIGERVKLPTKYGHFQLVPFQESDSGVEHMAIIKGDIKKDDVILTRIHSACATGDLFGSLRCDCGEQLIRSMKMIENNKKGVVIYLQQEGRGIGLMNKIKAYKLQENGMDTVDANIHLGFAPDERNYKIAAEILTSLGINRVNLITNNPEKIDGLKKDGIEIVERVPLEIDANMYNVGYLKTKKTRMNHLINTVHLEVHTQ